MSAGQRPLDPRDRASFDVIEAVIARIAPEWKGQPNLLGIVPALKTTGGYVREDTLAIGFHVSEKVAAELLADRGLRPVPAEIDGIPTDVILARTRPAGTVNTKDTRSQLFDTLVGGIAVGNANMDVYGTLGMVLMAVSDGRLVGLTNEHVLVFDIDGKVGDEVQQPRFFLNAEVSLDNAACCPNGQLHYRGVDNPVVDACAAVFAAAAIAAAASDVIDPHRRGQDATLPDATERTVREVVSMDIDYPTIPFPGRPYSVGAKWTYRRETDRRVLDHRVSETRANEHVVGVQELITDRFEYQRGETVTFLALLGPEPGREVCDRYFVTAAALSPSHHRAHKVILRPTRVGAAASHGVARHAVEGRRLRRCFGFPRHEPGESFRTPEVIEGLVYDPGGYTAVFAPGPGGAVALRFPGHGLSIGLRFHFSQVAADVLVRGSAVTLTAFHGSAVVGTAAAQPAAVVGTAAAQPAPDPQRLTVSGERIDRVVISGGEGESLLLQVCVERELGPFCVYRGTLVLAPDEEPGDWSTFLFAQTLNDVPRREDPPVAARTIGGLPVTDNFLDLGESFNIAYGTSCDVGLAPDGSFRVVAPAPVPGPG
jgi:hypothetical protein